MPPQLTFTDPLIPDPADAEIAAATFPQIMSKIYLRPSPNEMINYFECRLAMARYIWEMKRLGKSAQINDTFQERMKLQREFLYFMMRSQRERGIMRKY